MKVAENDWVGSPRCDNPRACEQLLIDRRDDIDVIGSVTDAESCYSYDDYALVRLDASYYLLSTSGCSCPSPDETWGVSVGPLTLPEMREYVTGKLGQQEYGVTKRQHSEFVAMVEEAEKLDAASRRKTVKKKRAK